MVSIVMIIIGSSMIGAELGASVGWGVFFVAAALWGSITN